MSPLIRQIFNSKEAKTLIMGTVIAFANKAIGAVAALCLAVLIARYLGSEQTGIYYTGLRLVLFVAFIARIGLDQILMRETAASVSGVSEAYHETFQRIVIISLGGTVISCGGLVLSSSFFSRYFGQAELSWILPWWALAAFATVTFSLAGQILRGAQNIWQCSFILFASVNIIGALILSLAAWKLTNLMGLKPLQAAVFAYLSATLITALIAARWTKPTVYKIDFQTSSKSNSLNYYSLLSSGVAFLIFGLSTRGIYWFDTIILAKFQESSQVAIYNSALRVSLVMSYVIAAVVTVVGPRLAALYRSGQHAKLRRVMNLSMLLTLGTATPVTAFLWLYGEKIMGLFGADFIRGATVLKIIVVGMFVSAALGPIGQVLIAAGKESIMRNMAAASLALNLTLHIFLVPKFGMLGSALATSGTVIALNLGTLIVVQHIIGFSNPVSIFLDRFRI